MMSQISAVHRPPLLWKPSRDKLNNSYTYFLNLFSIFATQTYLKILYVQHTLLLFCMQRKVHFVNIVVYQELYSVVYVKWQHYTVVVLIFNLNVFGAWGGLVDQHTFNIPLSVYKNNECSNKISSKFRLSDLICTFKCTFYGFSKGQ